MGQIDIVVIVPGAPPGTKITIIMPPDLFERRQKEGAQFCSQCGTGL